MIYQLQSTKQRSSRLLVCASKLDRHLGSTTYINTNTLPLSLLLTSHGILGLFKEGEHLLSSVITWTHIHSKTYKSFGGNKELQSQSHVENGIIERKKLVKTSTLLL